MKNQFGLFKQLGLVVLLSFSGKTALACGGMVFPGSFLCGSNMATSYSSGYPSLTASVIYVPNSLLGGFSQPISYPPNPYARKSTTTNPSYGYGYGYPNSYTYPYGSYSYPSAYSYPSSGYGCGNPFLNYGSNYGLGSNYGGLLGGLGGLGGLSSCGSNLLYPNYNIVGTGGYGGYGGSPMITLPVFNYPVTNNPMVTVVSPNNHGCSPSNGGAGVGVPSYSIPRPVCVQIFCGTARNLMRPISRGYLAQTNRLY